MHTKNFSAIHDLVYRRRSAETINIMSKAYSQYTAYPYRTRVSIKYLPRDEKKLPEDIDEMVSDLKLVRSDPRRTLLSTDCSHR